MGSIVRRDPDVTPPKMDQNAPHSDKVKISAPVLDHVKQGFQQRRISR